MSKKGIGLAFQASNTEHCFAEQFHVTIWRKDHKFITISNVKQINWMNKSNFLLQWEILHYFLCPSWARTRWAQWFTPWPRWGLVSPVQWHKAPSAELAPAIESVSAEAPSASWGPGHCETALGCPKAEMGPWDTPGLPHPNSQFPNGQTREKPVDSLQHSLMYRTAGYNIINTDLKKAFS